jgi:hypothetical protein
MSCPGWPAGFSHEAARSRPPRDRPNGSRARFALIPCFRPADRPARQAMWSRYIAINESLDGRAVGWMKKVSEEQYQRGLSARNRVEATTG